MMTVSVIMTCYNEGAFIKQAVQSVLDQTCADRIEKIVIVDDGSQQDTLDVLSAITKMDPRIEILYEQGNGVSKNRNLAVSQCSSDWIAMLDGDDVWLPTKLEKQFALSKTKSEVGLIYSGLCYFSEACPNAQIAAVADLSDEGDTEKGYFIKDGPITSTILVNREIFQKAGGYDPTLRVFEDTDLYSRLAAVTKFALVKEPLVHKRRHDQSITAARKNMLSHQAYVTFLIASRSPRLAPLVPARLSRAARKLGNLAVSEGNKEEAKNYYRLAAALNPFSVLAWGSYVALRFGFPMGRLRELAIRLRKSGS